MNRNQQNETKTNIDEIGDDGDENGDNGDEPRSTGDEIRDKNGDENGYQRRWPEMTEVNKMNGMKRRQKNDEIGDEQNGT